MSARKTTNRRAGAGALLGAAFMLLLIAAGCSKKSGTTAPPMAAAAAANSAAQSTEPAAGQRQTPPQQALSMETHAPASGAQAATAMPPVQATPEQGLPPALRAERDFGLGAYPTRPVLPTDSLIGPLQDWRTDDAAASGALAAARAFLDGLLRGEIKESSVLPERLPLVKMLIGSVLDDPKPIAYRIGAIVSAGTEGDLTSVAAVAVAWGPIRRTRPENGAHAEASANSTESKGELVGELGLRMKNGVWYIESVDLRAPAAAAGGP